MTPWAFAFPLLLAPAPAPDAEAILRRSERAVLGDTATYTLRMTVTRPGKADRVVDMDGWKKGDDKGRVRYTAPPRERGTAYLRNGASTWLFLPSAQKVVRVGAKQNFGGGDFSNADIFRLSLTKDYEATLAGEETVDGQACWRLELKARDRSVAYDRVVTWIRADGTDFPVRSEYYTLSGRRLKWLTVSDVARLGGRARPTRLVMESALDPGARTTLLFRKVEDGVALDDRLFAPSALETGS
jgi:outer membrane lipoprotein-sorting protein